MEDQRKHQRFGLDGTCIIQHEIKVGTVTNVSMGGVYCKCFGKDKCHTGRSFNVNIYCRKHELCAEDITIQVLDSKVLPGLFAEDLGVRKCRVKFEQLEDLQRNELSNFIVRTSLP
jgi:hypothetical protein